jgi:hypothetical protein
MKKINKKRWLTVSYCTGIAAILLVSFAFASISSCKKNNIVATIEPAPVHAFTMDQTISEGAQTNTIAFDALSMMTNNLGAQTFFPPGKVADFSGFQYFRDNDPTDLGHNTSFLTIVANSVLSILTAQQRQIFIDKAAEHATMLNNYAYMRFSLCKAFRRLMEGDLPTGKTTLDEDSVKAYSARLYRLDGIISYDRAKIFGQIIASFSSEQLAKMNALKALKGVGTWNSNVADPLGNGLARDVKVGVMTFASEMFSWFAGNVTSDTYFCPERHGTYFGGFYLKDWPAMGNPNYSINEQLTASAGTDFLSVLNSNQKNLMTGITNEQKTMLLAVVEDRKTISTELRKFLTTSNPDQTTVLNLCEQYGRHDGDLIYRYATVFAKVYQSLTATQKDQLKAIVNKLGYINPEGAFLYSQAINMPSAIDTDFLFK